MNLNTCCAGMAGCVKCGVKDGKSTLITEFILNLLSSIAIDLGVEYDKSHLKTWLEKSLLSSGIAATCMIVISTFLRIAKYNCAELTEAERPQQANPAYYYLATLLSEIISGVISFGAGVGLDELIELAIGHDKLKTWESSGSFLFAVVVPIAITCTKSLGRFGIFRLTDHLINKCRNNEDNHELDPLVVNTPTASA